MMIFLWTLIGIGILCVLLGCSLPFITDRPEFILFILGGIISIPGITGIMCEKHPIPTNDDVLNGKAIYVETTHITNGDTVRTYKIQWLND